MSISLVTMLCKFTCTPEPLNVLPFHISHILILLLTNNKVRCILINVLLFSFAKDLNLCLYESYELIVICLRNDQILF